MFFIFPILLLVLTLIFFGQGRDGLSLSVQPAGPKKCILQNWDAYRQTGLVNR